MKAKKPAEINWEKFDDLCMIFTPLSEIAATLGLSEEGIELAVRRVHGVPFKEYAERHRERGREALRAGKRARRSGGGKTP